jgi:hypothetical protein
LYHNVSFVFDLSFIIMLCFIFCCFWFVFDNNALF